VRREEIGYIPYADVVVNTIRNERRGFVRARNAANLRRREVTGRADERVDSCDEASGGSSDSAASSLAVSSFNRFLRR
jgi:hypothetical protein